jgi:hypothetical protein
VELKAKRWSRRVSRLKLPRSHIPTLRWVYYYAVAWLGRVVVVDPRRIASTVFGNRASAPVRPHRQPRDSFIFPFPIRYALLATWKTRTKPFSVKLPTFMRYLLERDVWVTCYLHRMVLCSQRNTTNKPNLYRQSGNEYFKSTILQ